MWKFRCKRNEEIYEMKKTVGMKDKMLRVVIAAGAVVLAGVIGFSSLLGIVLILAAMVLLVTGASGYCPLYSALGIDTTEHNKTGIKGRV